MKKSTCKERPFAVFGESKTLHPTLLEIAALRGRELEHPNVEYGCRE
jgi:hypothetical protein